MKSNSIIIGLALAGVGILLLRDPHCQRGCKTVAEHLLAHGLDDFLGTLLA